jgi:hypothetical protein
MYDDEGFDFEDEDDQPAAGSPKALRDAHKKAARENAELKAQIAKIQTQLAQRNLQDVLQAKGLNPALGRFVLADGVDATDTAAVDSWLNENGSLFGVTPSAPDEQEAPDELAAEFAAMQNTQLNALPTGKFSEAQSALGKAESVEEINAVLRKAAG